MDRMPIADHHRPIYGYTHPARGFYIPESSPRRPATVYIPNKPYANFGRLIYAFTANANTTLVDVNGSNQTLYMPEFRISGSVGASQSLHRSGFRLSFGSATTPHDIYRYELYSPHTQLRWTTGIGFLEKTSQSTILWIYSSFGIAQPSLSCGEVGLYLSSTAATGIDNRFLLARAILDPPVEKVYGEWYEEGWMITFPANYTPVLPALLAWVEYAGGSGLMGRYDSNGTPAAIRNYRPFTGSPAVMIGSDNSPPSPDDFRLRSPIASLTNVSVGLEIDTTLQEIRVIAQGAYTPTSNVYLGEVGLFYNLYDPGNTARYFMVARAVWDAPILLQANQTYTIGIVLRFA